MTRLISLLIFLLSAWPGFSGGAQAPAAGVVISGSLRTRIESWHWFGGAEGTYTYPGTLFRLAFAQSKTKHDWQLELALPLILGLPDHPVGSQGRFGLGANYFNANGGSPNVGMPFVKHAFVQLKDFGGIGGQSIKIGRMEFFEGAEVLPADATLAALKRDRIAQRLVGNFGFTHVGRSLDGAQYAINRPNVTFTFIGARPTRGVFQVDGWG